MNEIIELNNTINYLKNINNNLAKKNKNLLTSKNKILKNNQLLKYELNEERKFIKNIKLINENDIQKLELQIDKLKTDIELANKQCDLEQKKNLEFEWISLEKN